VTIVGEAGVGKSRLVGEFLSSVGATRIVRGRAKDHGQKGDRARNEGAGSRLGRLPDRNTERGLARAGFLCVIARSNPHSPVQSLRGRSRVDEHVILGTKLQVHLASA
jgi:hypothetical protein